jgi:hypothetical protein
MLANLFINYCEKQDTNKGEKIREFRGKRASFPTVSSNETSFPTQFHIYLFVCITVSSA